MAIETKEIQEEQLAAILEKEEGQFLDFKASLVKPSKLSQTLSAFANADGGEIFLGIADSSEVGNRWAGFQTIEDANAHIQEIEKYFPLGLASRLTFLICPEKIGAVLHIEIDKTGDIRASTNGKVYLRRGAQNLPQESADQIKRLELNKGIRSHEDQTINTNPNSITNSNAIIEFLIDVVPNAEPEPWLTKQKLIDSDKPTVAGLLLFSDEPQTEIPKAAIKIYRYKTADEEGTRDTLDFDPVAIEGNAYNQVYDAVKMIKEITEKIPLLGQAGLEEIIYPTEAIHEIVTNAVIHRDYSINDDIHIRIFDNRIEVESPGILPGHVTIENILNERSARNPKTVRLLNKFKNPPNKDVGEGLNTAFEAMRKVKLKDPSIKQREASVLVTLRHEKLGTPEQIIVEYLKGNEEINNSKAREICFIGSENTMKRVFQKMMKAEVIERIPDRPLNKTGYVKGKNFPT